VSESTARNSATPNTPASESVQTPELFDTIKVSNIPQTSMGTIEWYFQNERRSGGGVIAKFRPLKEKGQAFVQFKDPAG